jgi:hypothetical protein
MATISFTLTFDISGVPPTAARLWVDADGDDLHQDGEEVTLGTADARTWLGTVDLPDDRVSGTLFLLRFVAPVGAVWGFEAKAGDTSLYAVADLQLAHSREQLAGRLA